MTRKITTVLMLVLLVSGCAMDSAQTKAGKGTMWGAGIGAAVGAGLGKVLGGDTKSALIGAGLGAALGAGAGHAWGKSLDEQEAQLREKLATSDVVKIERKDDQLSLTFKSDTMFDSGVSVVKSEAQNEITQVATVLNKYPESIIIVRGHTDSVGSDTANQDLSENRSQAVKTILVEQGVNTDRILTIGYGETEPVSSNDTEVGRQANRRVEISIAKPEIEKS